MLRATPAVAPLVMRRKLLSWLGPQQQQLPAQRLLTTQAARIKASTRGGLTSPLLLSQQPRHWGLLLSSHFRILSTAANDANQQQQRWKFWKRLAWWVRTLRIPVLVLSVFGLGYQQGIIECTKHPQALQEQILRALLAGHGVVDLEHQVDILSEENIGFLNPHPNHQVAAVGHRIISSARVLIKEELEQAMQDVLKKLPPDVSPEKAEQAINKDSNVQFWYHAALRLFGEVNSSSLVLDVLHMAHDAIEQQQSSTSKRKQPLDQQLSEQTHQRIRAGAIRSPVTGKKLVQVPWQYVFVKSSQPNAFVSEVLPQRFFITTGMLEVATTPDELALILGHEISHLILGHVSQTNHVETMLRTIEVLLLSLDPTSGFLSLVVVGSLATLRSAVSAAHSRENEREADELGLKITARACYDTVAGSNVMYKMHHAKLSMAPNGGDSVLAKTRGGDRKSPSQQLQLLDTHPPTLERYKQIKEQAEAGENYTKYQDDLCVTVSRRIYAALGWGCRDKTAGGETEEKQGDGTREEKQDKATVKSESWLSWFSS